jgi:hypothetical protein
LNKVPEYHHRAPSQGSIVSLPINDSKINTRELLLYKLTKKICEQFQQKVRISVEPINSEKDNGNALISRVDGLVDKYMVYPGNEAN